MAAIQSIKRRIGSVKNTRQITKAMQLVAASKLRRAQDAVEGPRVYARLARELLTRLRQLAGADAHELFRGREVKARLIIAIASDRGLAGAYNSNIQRRLVEELKADRAAGVQTSVIAIGRHVGQFASRLRDCEVVGFYDDMPDTPDPNQLRAITATLFKLFQSQSIDAADLLFTDFVSTVSQQVRLRRVLPAGFKDAELSHDIKQADFEPSVDEVLQRGIVRLIEAQLFQAILDARASEHAMRMLAMKNATDNATEIVDDLTLVYNNARQANITQELAEITGGAEALNG